MSACVSLEPFALRVLDDSMAPDLPAGAVVIVDPGEPPGDGALVVLEHEGEVLLRRLRLPASASAEEAGRARFVSPAGPDLVPDGGWRRAVRGVVTGARPPRERRAARPSRGPRGGSDRPGASDGRESRRWAGQDVRAAGAGSELQDPGP